MTRQYTDDPWQALREFTSARIALGRAGVSTPTRELLTFQAHHARAIDAVYTEFDRDAMAAALRERNIESVFAESRAETRQDYLQRPDHGRRLNDASRERLSRTGNGADVAIVVADGLSAIGVERNALAVVAGLHERQSKAGFTWAPVVLVKHGRVALQDEIGSILQARVVVSLIGERPGLGSPDSLGAYLVFGPKPGNTDANRNCISNIRDGGLTREAAVEAIDWLIQESLRRKLSGVELKDDRQLVAPDKLPKLS